MRWYKRDCDSYRSTMGLEVMDLLGLDGYARWAIILEIIGEEMDGQSEKCSRTMPEKDWCKLLRCRPKVLENLLRTLAEVSQKSVSSYSEVGKKTVFFSTRDGTKLTIGEPKMLTKMDDSSNRVRRECEQKAAQIESKSKSKKERREEKSAGVENRSISDYDKIKLTWNQTAIKSGLAQVRVFGDKLKRRYKTATADKQFNFNALLMKIKEAPPKFTDDNGKKWRGDLDYCLREWEKIMNNFWVDQQQAAPQKQNREIQKPAPAYRNEPGFRNGPWVWNGDDWDYKLHKGMKEDEK